MDFIEQFLNGTFMPHGHCFLWRSDLLFMHVGGDLATAAAYFAIPAALVQLVRNRTDLAFNWMVLMFALFIFFCGTTHLIDAVNVWKGYYHLEGLAKLLTAAVSLITAVLVWRLLPRALSVPSHEELLAKNTELLALQEELRESNARLEARVVERTRDLERLAATDGLTGLGNRRELMRQLTRELARAQRHEDPLSILMLDIDDFKRLNDLHGHHAGDAVLKQAAALFRRECRATDIVARYGGEEFVILMPKTSTPEARTFAERLLTEMREERVLSGEHEISFTCSIGVTAAKAGDDLEELVNRADRAMYEAKMSGKNSVVTYDGAG